MYIGGDIYLRTRKSSLRSDLLELYNSINYILWESESYDMSKLRCSSPKQFKILHVLRK